MKVGLSNPEAVTAKQPTKTTEEVLKSSQQFLQNNKLKPTQRAYDMKVETASSKTDRTIQEKTVAANALQTSDVGMKKTEDAIKKMQALAEKATDSKLTSQDRAKLQEQYADLQKEIDKTSESTNFNGHKLLDGKFELETNTSNNSRQNRNIAIGNMSSEGLGVAKTSLSSPEAAAEAAKKLKTASETVATERKNVQDEQKTLQQEVSNLTEIKDFANNNKKVNFKKLDNNTDVRELVKTMKEDMMKQASEMKNNMYAFNASRVFSLLN